MIRLVLGTGLALFAAGLAVGARGAPAPPVPLPDLGAGVAVSRLSAGGLAIVHPERGAPIAAVELWYRAPSIGFTAKPQPGLARLAAQAVAASKPLVGPPLGERVADAGGILQIAVFSDSLEISAVVPAPAASDIVKAMTLSYFAPVLTAGGFALAQREVAQEAYLAPADIDNFVRDAVFAQLFRDGPQHFPAIGDAKSVSSLPYAEVQSFATRAFRASNANLVVSGAVDPGVASAATSGRAGEPANAEAPVTGALSSSRTPVVRTALQPLGGFGWLGPPIADERDATAMDFIADYLFRRGTGTIPNQAAQRYPATFIDGQFITLHGPGVMLVTYGGPMGSQVRDLIASGVAAMTRPLAAATFTTARAAFAFHLLRDLQTPGQLADDFGWYAVEGNPAYAQGASGQAGPYFAAIDALTPEYVAAVARKYLAAKPALVTFTPPQNPANAP